MSSSSGLCEPHQDRTHVDVELRYIDDLTINEVSVEPGLYDQLLKA